MINMATAGSRQIDKAKIKLSIYGYSKWDVTSYLVNYIKKGRIPEVLVKDLRLKEEFILEKLNEFKLTLPEKAIVLQAAVMAADTKTEDYPESHYNMTVSNLKSNLGKKYGPEFINAFESLEAMVPFKGSHFKIFAGD